MLNQRVGEGLAPISFYSRLLSPAEQNYTIYEKECLAVLFGCEKCRPYLEHTEFELRCDNLAVLVVETSKGGWSHRQVGA